MIVHGNVWIYRRVPSCSPRVPMVGGGVAMSIISLLLHRRQIAPATVLTRGEKLDPHSLGRPCRRDSDGGGDLVVPLLHHVDNVAEILAHELDVGTGDPVREGAVDVAVLRHHGEDDDKVVLLGHAVDVAHAGIVKQLSMCVEARFALCAIQMTLHGGGS